MVNYEGKIRCEVIMSDYKLIVSDLDGTLLNDKMQLTEENQAAIKKFKEMGIEFVASSGRTLHEIPISIRENPDIRYITYSNGTAIYDKQSGKDIVSNRISQKTANEVFDIIDEYDVFFSLHANGYSNIDKSRTSDGDFAYYQINDYYKTLLMRSVMLEKPEKMARETDGLEAVVLFFHSDKELLECQNRLKKIKGITVTSSIGHNIELCSDRAGKGKALCELAKILNIPKEKIIAAGDNMNDTSMFSAAGLSLCTGNGNENAKKLATRVICTNNESVADYILTHYIIK